MPKIVVEGPDGRKFAFPDTMPRAEINAFMKQKYGTKAPNESVQDYLARYGREQAATEARVKDIDREATAVGRAEGERAAGRMGVSNPFEMAFAAPAIGLAQQEGGRRVFEREGTVLADEAAGLSAANAAAFFVPGMVNKQFGAQLEEGRRQQPLAAFAGDIAGGFGPGEIIGAGVSKAVQAIGPGMAALGRMFARGPGPDTTNAIVGGTLGGIAPAETAEERARNVAVGAGLGAVARPVSKMAADFTTPGAPSAMPDAMPAGGYLGRQSMRPPGSGPSPREIEIRQEWSTATPIVSQARTTAQSAQQAADAALQSKAPADIARAQDQKKALVGQLQEAQASRAGMDTPEDARLAETLASLAENTSDPVLLSTQISAAKTSLDRLLTDIGSPVEGNLIPVKTNILTRTQAPRSAAEPAPERASVTRYAEGSDEVKPQGFGAGANPTSDSIRQKVVGAYAETEGLSNRDRGSRLKQAVEDYRSFVRTASADELRATSDLHFDRDLLLKLEAPQLAKMMKTLGLPAPSPTMALNEMRDAIKQAINPSTPSPISPMGFGASTPKTPQQSVRFETPGSPEYEAAVAKGLDMSTPARMARAKEMGFDTETVLYHGTGEDIAAFSTSKARDVQGRRNALGLGRGKIYMSAEPNVASMYAGVRGGDASVMPLYVRGKLMEQNEYEKLFEKVSEQILGTPRKINEPYSFGYEQINRDAIIDALDDAVKAQGFAGIKDNDLGQYAIFDPSNIRSVHAAFDPDKAGSSTLLAAAPFAAVGGAGMTAERELGSKMKRDKKD